MPSSRCHRCRKDLCGSPDAWNVTTTLLAGFSIIAGFYFLTRSCTRPDIDTPALDCAAHSAYLVPDKLHALYFIVCAFAFLIIFIYHLLILFGVTCDGFCNNKRSTVFLSYVSLGLVIYFVIFLNGILDEVPKTTIADPDACLVCPDADNVNYRLLLTAAIVCASVGAVGTSVACWFGNDDSSAPKGYRAHLNAMEMRQQCTLPQDDHHRSNP